jgi:hypothetical protein
MSISTSGYIMKLPLSPHFWTRDTLLTSSTACTTLVARPALALAVVGDQAVLLGSRVERVFDFTSVERNRQSAWSIHSFSR